MRYFMLFITHLYLYCIVIASSTVPVIILNDGLTGLSNDFKFICILSTAGCVILTFFNTWNWFLVINGNTTIEFWSIKAGLKSSIDFSLSNWRENLFIVFGTRSLLKSLFVPSITKLPYSGLEWSRLIDDGYSARDINDSVGYEVINNVEGV